MVTGNPRLTAPGLDVHSELSCGKVGPGFCGRAQGCHGAAPSAGVVGAARSPETSSTR